MLTAAAEPSWPPRSPHEALLSSPSGRKKLSQIIRHRSISPSPASRSKVTVPSHNKNGQLEESLIALDDEDEDEETLKLQLQAIQAKLKLKKLRSRPKLASEVQSGSVDVSLPVPEQQRTTLTTSGKTVQAKRERANKSSHQRDAHGDIQIPLSPPQKRTITEQPQSPSRVLLGIDKGLKGRDVSLRRAAALRDNNNCNDDPFNGHPQRPLSRGNKFSSAQHTTVQEGEAAAPAKSFSERMAEIRAHDKDAKKRGEEVRKKRSKGFGINGEELEQLQKQASTETSTASAAGMKRKRNDGTEFTREEVVNAFSKSANGRTQQKPTAKECRDTHRVHADKAMESHTMQNADKQSVGQNYSRQSSTVKFSRPHSPAVSGSRHDDARGYEHDPALRDTYTSLQLSKRLIPETYLNHTIQDKKILLVPDLLRTVKSPDYQLPEIEGDYVVFGIVASKSAPRDHKDNHKATGSDSGRGKYMVLTLTDLQWELNLYLFTTAFDRFWKLAPGTVVAILNPGVMPPRAADIDTGRFSLVLNSSDDTILEVGTAQDLGFCKSVKRDGKTCDAWVDKRHTDFCTFHVDRQIAKTKAGRMEVNTISAPFAPGGRNGPRTGFFGSTGRARGGRGHASTFRDDGLKKEGAQYDRASSSRYFVAPPTMTVSGRTTVALLDEDDTDPHRGGNREERTRQRLAAREKEREIAKKLSEGGNGSGQEYLRLAHSHANAKQTVSSAGDVSLDDVPPSDPQVLDAFALGLLDNKAPSVSLSPLKKKRPEGIGIGAGQGPERPVKKKMSVTAKGVGEAEVENSDIWAKLADENEDHDAGLDAQKARAVGSTPRKRKRLEPGSGLEQGTERPVKKTRFVTAKGIREAGNESMDVWAQLADEHGDDDDDDGLDII